MKVRIAAMATIRVLLPLLIVCGRTEFLDQESFSDPRSNGVRLLSPACALSTLSCKSSLASS